MKKSNKKIVFNKFIENPVMSENIFDAWVIKAFFKTAEEAWAAVDGIKLANPNFASKFRVRGRGKWTPEKMGQYVTYQLKKYGEVRNTYIPKDMPVSLADYVVLYIY